MITFTGLTAIVRGGELGHHDQLSPPAPWWSLTKAALAAGALVLVAGGRGGGLTRMSDTSSSAA